MSASLFTAPLGAITAADVEAFLDFNLEEGTVLDYKEADPKQKTGIPDTTFKAIAAFANTLGGLILIGVGIDGQTNGPGKRGGIPYKQGLEEALTSKCYGLIYPPVAPEVRICPFKSEPALSVEDRAYVIIRVAPSTTVHAMKGAFDNRVFVRINSECRDADLATLRILLDRERLQEQRLRAVTEWLQDGVGTVRRRFMPELQDEARKLRWEPESHRIRVAFVPVDAASDLFSFWTAHAAASPSLDSRVVELMRAAGYWYTEGMGPDDLVPLSRGLGVVAIARQRSTFLQQIGVTTNPVDVMYIDASGGMSVDLATKSLGWDHPREDGCEPSVLTEQLMKRLVRAMRVLGMLLQEREYSGRVQVDIWLDRGGQPVPPSQIQGDRGEALLSILHGEEDRQRQLAVMVSQLTRSWLGYPFQVTSWSGDTPSIERL